jgi:UDP-N-acetylmuramate: L-alanyl-gamma-D-glutamyl-meso-diaminopimelate ligase
MIEIVTSKTQQLGLDSIRHVHVIGVCGTLMGAFAAYLKRAGIRVTGSDQNVYPPMSDVLKKAGVELLSGYRAENFQAIGKPDLVVIGNVISANNPEARAAIDGGYSYTSLPEAMERLLLGSTRNLVVAGTHGKTTTSSLLAYVLVKLGKDPSYFIGGVPADLPYSFNVTGPKGCFVLEGDEYDTAFWDKVPKFNHYLPDDAILTSIEYDHADIYPDFQAVVRAFEGLVSRIRPGGRLIACFDFPAVKELVAQATVPVLSYGSEGSGGRFTAFDVRLGGDGTRFRIRDGKNEVAEIMLQIPGQHNVMNALSVWIECRELGLEAAGVAAALASFRGVKRRQEERGKFGDVLVIDDFAHHPTAVRETLRALRGRYPDRRLVTVFEPRSATSRRKVFQKDYGDAFRGADSIFIAVPYDQTKIAADDQFSSGQLVDDLKRVGKDAHLFESVETGVQNVAALARKGDLVAVLSNGGFGGFIPKLIDALTAKFPTKNS